MNQVHSKQNTLKKTFDLTGTAKWLTIGYIVLLHIALIVGVITITKDKGHITQQQAEKVAYGEAIARCLKQTDLGKGCTNIALRSSDNHAVGYNEQGINGWSFAYIIGDTQDPDFRTDIAISVSGRIVQHSDFAPSLR